MLYRHSKRGAQRGNDDVNIMVDGKKILLPRQTSCILWTAFWTFKIFFWEDENVKEERESMTFWMWGDFDQMRIITWGVNTAIMGFLVLMKTFWVKVFWMFDCDMEMNVVWLLESSEFNILAWLLGFFFKFQS